MGKIERDSEDSAERPNLRSLYLAIPVVLSIVVVILLLSMIMIPEERCPSGDQVKMDLIGLSDGWYDFSIADTCILEEDRPGILTLQNVYLEIRSGGLRVEFMDQDTVVNSISLGKAKKNGANPLYWGTVTYFDTDGDNNVSIGDHLKIMSMSHGGPLEEGGGLELRDTNWNSRLLTYSCCEQ